jgi:hypothetical protein
MGTKPLTDWFRLMGNYGFSQLKREALVETALIGGWIRNYTNGVGWIDGSILASPRVEAAALAGQPAAYPARRRSISPRERGADYQATPHAGAASAKFIVIRVKLATPIHRPHLNFPHRWGMSANHLPSVALMPSHTATTKPVTITVMTALNT